MNIDTGQEAPRQTARRRLLRGAFSAPAALTLCSGRAMAAASSLRCVANQQGTNAIVAVPSVSEGNQTYVRINLYSKNTTNGTKYFVRGQDLKPFSVDSTYTGWPTATQARRFDIGTNKFFDKDPVATPQGLAASSKWAVLRIDGKGFVVGVGESGLTGGSAIYQSCWTSFKIGGL